MDVRLKEGYKPRPSPIPDPSIVGAARAEQLVCFEKGRKYSETTSMGARGITRGRARVGFGRIVWSMQAQQARLAELQTNTGLKETAQQTAVQRFK